MSGLVGIYSKGKDISLDLYYSMYAIQHRGQDSLGIVTLFDEKLSYFHEKGTIADNISGSDLNNYKGCIGVGHVHNGNYSNNKPIKQPHVLEDGSIVAIEGKIISEDFSVEKFVHILSLSDKDIAEYVANLEGAFCIICVKDSTMVVIRDVRGIKPISVGIKGEEYIVSSETCAFDGIGASFYKDVIPGEIMKIDENGIKSIYAKPANHQLCLFEMLYTQRPDSIVEGVSVYQGRYRSGNILARENPTPADIVIGAPDSGIIAAQGYSDETGIPYKTGLIKNRYVARTFINPSEDTRNMDVRLKLNAIKDVVAGKNIILVDDSIVRGTTMKRTIEILKDAGAKTIHVRVACPPIVGPDNLSINIPDANDLLAYNYTREEMETILGCNSLRFLSIEGLREAFGNKGYYEKYFERTGYGDKI